MSEDDRRAGLLRRFQATIAGAELDDLHALAGDLSRRGAQARPEPARPRRPELRRPRLAEVQLFRVRIDLRHAKPPIWRRLEVRSDLTLDLVHRVLQAAFSWTDSHLWRFSIGGDPFDTSSQLFLCTWDDEEGEIEAEGGVPASTVRLDEAVQVPGEILSYVYDYGDNWELTVQLEYVRPAAPGTPSAVAVDGRRAAPPEDCGGCRTADELEEVLEDPSLFDVHEINEALQAPLIVLHEHRLEPRLVNLIDRLTYSPVGEDLTCRALALVSEHPRPDDETLGAALKPFIWFLDRAADDGIPLTASGYLRPADVTTAAELLPTMHGWIGKPNREIDTTPVLRFRKTLQSLGLLRKHKGTLQLTRAGRLARVDRQGLWDRLMDRLLPSTDGFDTEATLLLLAYAATSPDAELPLDTIASALNYLGWQSHDGTPIDCYDLYWLPVVDALRNVSITHPGPRQRWHISVPAAQLARGVLRTH